jgi:aarF domain-containing kinase
MCRNVHPNHVLSQQLRIIYTSKISESYRKKGRITEIMWSIFPSTIIMISNLFWFVMMVQVQSSSFILAFHIQQHQQSYSTINHQQSMSISSSPTKRRRKLTLNSSRIQDVLSRTNIQDIQMGDVDDDASLIIQALRGRNLNDDDTADAGLQMKLVNIAGSGSRTSSSSTLNRRETDVETGLPYAYNPVALKEFFKKRPIVVITRIMQLMNVGGNYVLSLLFDRLLQRNDNNPDIEIQRAIQLRTILTSLGPFYIKIGQALSIRPDVLSPRSMVELQKLCDKVPSYDSKIAFAMFETELGKPVYEIFSEITPEPVAAASLGQVYKATLRDSGDIVAVKIQRPGVLETVSLDLYLAREFGLLVRNIPAFVQRFDPVALLDEFAYRFYQELDYNLECLNGIRIANDMKVLPMVVIPKNYPQYTTRRVHVAQWIEGEKLSQSTADDVSSLVNLGVITYMTMLLGGAKDANGNDSGGGSGFFHAEYVVV